ncbi:Uncharacterised protein [Bordetella pertussis]|nr:Uncharacterised protein [Bordetella pertussis]
MPSVGSPGSTPRRSTGGGTGAAPPRRCADGAGACNSESKTGPAPKEPGEVGETDISNLLELKS